MGRRGRPRAVRHSPRDSARTVPATDDAARGWALVAGVLLGIALLFRLDLVARGRARHDCADAARPRSAAHRNGCCSAPRSESRRMLIHVVTAGLGNVVDGMILEPVFDLRGGRSLPIPPRGSTSTASSNAPAALEQLSWPIPRVSGRAAAVPLVLRAARSGRVPPRRRAARCVRRDPASLHARSLLVVALLQRRTAPPGAPARRLAHFAWVGCVPFAFLPVAIFEVLRRRAPTVPTRRLAIASGAGVLVALTLVIPAFTAQRYADYVAGDVRRAPELASHRARRAASSTTAKPTAPTRRTR